MFVDQEDYLICEDEEYLSGIFVVSLGRRGKRSSSSSVWERKGDERADLHCHLQGREEKKTSAVGSCVNDIIRRSTLVDNQQIFSYHRFARRRRRKTKHNRKQTLLKIERTISTFVEQDVEHEQIHRRCRWSSVLFALGSAKILDCDGNTLPLSRWEWHPVLRSRSTRRRRRIRSTRTRMRRMNRRHPSPYRRLQIDRQTKHIEKKDQPMFTFTIVVVVIIGRRFRIDMHVGLLCIRC